MAPGVRSEAFGCGSSTVERCQGSFYGQNLQILPVYAHLSLLASMTYFDVQVMSDQAIIGMNRCTFTPLLRKRTTRPNPGYRSVTNQVATYIALLCETQSLVLRSDSLGGARSDTIPVSCTTVRAEIESG